MKVLFLCTHNSCRSQMAEGWAKHLKKGVIEAWSAGTDPGTVNPLAIRVMAEAGVDISSHKSRHLQEFLDIPFDVVITLCGDARDTCPFFPGRSKRMMHRGFDDPSRAEGSPDEVLDFFRRVRDEIRDFVEGMPENLEQPGL
ncbi:MAG: arsenate reductase ArsC [Thermovirgaceae bacterium]|nr:arsenate reductase ArsC [Thermovirgaceae bacterium]